MTPGTSSLEKAVGASTSSVLYSYSKGTPEELHSQYEAGTEDIVSGVTKELELELSDNQTSAKEQCSPKTRKETSVCE